MPEGEGSGWHTAVKEVFSFRGAGVEPGSQTDVTPDNECTCESCQGWRAALALQSGRSDCHALASLDADLQRVIAAWDELPSHIRKTILASLGSLAPGYLLRLREKHRSIWQITNAGEA
jgi:hypothetical protein